MNARKFSGTTSREILGKVKAALGADALIVSSRNVDGGMEVVAMPAHALGEVRPGAAAVKPQPQADGLMGGILGEIRDVRALLQREFAALGCSDLLRGKPVHAAALRDLLAAGFSPALARRMIDAIGDSTSAGDGMQRIAAALAKGLPVSDVDEVAARGGVYALVGPTGVGKTTTVAKLAARAVVRHGAGKVALLTTDSYRIAAHDQLRVFGKILGVPVHAVQDGQNLHMLLADLQDRHTVLIDTIGMSQRDRRVAEQASLLAAGGGAIRRLLLVNATSSGATLDEVIDAYRRGGIDGCIITKVDEAAGLAPAVDAAIRHRLPVHYLTNGQRVPEDLHLPNRGYLAHRALRLPAGSAANSLNADECPLVMSADTALAREAVSA